MVTGQVRTILRLALAHILVILLRSVSVVTYYGRERTALQQYISLFLSKSTLSLESGGFCSLRGTVFTLSTRALKIETFRMAGRQDEKISRKNGNA